MTLSKPVVEENKAERPSSFDEGMKEIVITTMKTNRITNPWWPTACGGLCLRWIYVRFAWYEPW
jgi:hypothetical protein